MIKRCILWPLIRVWISGGITEHLFLDRNQYVNVINRLVLIKDKEILAIILVTLIMTLSRGHTGQIKGQS